MKLLLYFLVCLSAFSQTYSAISVTDISHSAAAIKWTTSSATGNYIKYGTTASYGSVSDGGGSQTTHEWFVSGLDAATEYHYQLCNNSGSCDATDRTFTTASLPEPHLAQPIAPTSTPSIPAMPTSWGSTQAVAACADLQDAIDTAAADDGDLNHLIELDASLDCSFSINYGVGFGGPAAITFPAKSGSNSSGTGWIVIRTSGTQPPEGNHVTSDYYSEMPIWRVGPNTQERGGPQTSGTCIAGQKYWSFIPAAWGLYECTTPASNTYSLTAKTDFSGAIPSSCATNNSWYYKTDASYPASVYWCGDNKLYAVNIGYTNAGGQIAFAANAHHYWISGIRFLPTPTASGGVPASWAAYNYDFNYTVGLFDLHTNSGIHDIIIERNQVDISYPYRLRWVVLTKGTDIVVAHNNIVADHHVPTQGDAAGCNQCHTSVVQMAGADNILIDNNYIDASGIVIYAIEDSPSLATTDVTVTRNYLSNGNKRINGNDANTTYCGGCFFSSRHSVELKMGSRWLIKGNKFDSHFATSINQGDLIAISTRPWTNRVPISDIKFEKNMAWSIPNFAYVIGHNDTLNQQAAATTRISFVGNLVYDIDGNRYTAGASQREGRGFRLFYGPEDVTIQNNTILNSCTGYAPWLAENSEGSGEGLDLSNNLASACSVTAPYYFIGRVSVGGGTTGLNSGWPASTGYTVTNNIFYDAGGGLTGTGYPSGNTWPASLAAIGFIDTSVSDYRLKYSSDHAAAGAAADIDEINAAYGEPYNLRALSITSSGATVAYTAPDATTSCTIEYGTSVTAGTGSRVTDTPTSRFRTKALTGLSSATTYHFRVYCGKLAAGEFVTQ